MAGWTEGPWSIPQTEKLAITVGPPGSPSKQLLYFLEFAWTTWNWIWALKIHDESFRFQTVSLINSFFSPSLWRKGDSFEEDEAHSLLSGPSWVGCPSLEHEIQTFSFCFYVLWCWGRTWKVLCLVIPYSTLSYSPSILYSWTIQGCLLI